MRWVIVVAAVLVAGGGVTSAQETPELSVSERLESLEERLLDVEERLAVLESDRACANVYEQAVAYTTVNGKYNTSVPALWDGTPFTVDISSALPNASTLLDAVRQEAEKVEAALGYQVFVAGSVRPLENRTKSQLDNVLFWISPHQRIEIRCCYHPGTAYPWWRIILLPTLANDDAASIGGHARINLIHELYHVLGFRHSDETEGVTMSYPLDFALQNPLDEYGNIVGDSYDHTISTSGDLAQLACIYD